MKKLFVLSFVVFSLGFLLAACGGGSKKTLLPEKTVQPEATRTTVVSPPVAKATSGKGEQTVDVAGKTCLPAGTYKVTSKDLTEAVVNTVCQAVEHYVEGTMEFVSLQLIQQQGNEGINAKVKVSFRDCDDCPRDFIDLTSFSKNPLGEWQLSSGVRVELEETEESRYAKLAYNLEKTMVAVQAKAADVRIELSETSLFTDSGSPFLNVRISVFGEPQIIKLLGQYDDGSVENFRTGDSGPSRRFMTEKQTTFYEKTHVVILAYSFSLGSYESDWIYFNQ